MNKSKIKCKTFYKKFNLIKNMFENQSGDQDFFLVFIYNSNFFIGFCFFCYDYF